MREGREGEGVSLHIMLNSCCNDYMCIYKFYMYSLQVVIQILHVHVHNSHDCASINCTCCIHYI